jgi:hypothetical protein
LRIERDVHLSKISKLNNEVTQLTSQLEDVKEQLKRINSSTNMYDKPVEEQGPRKPKAFGFDYKAINRQQQGKKFIPTEGTTYDPKLSSPMLQHPKKHQGGKSMGKSKPWI